MIMKSKFGIKPFVGNKEFLYYQKHFGFKPPLITNAIRFVPKEREYTLGRVSIGYYAREQREYTINFAHSKRILILGSTGSGKTVLTNTIMDRFLKAGGLVSVFDLKGEYTRKAEPLQEQFANKIRDKHKVYLFDDEKPQGFPCKIYYPAFLQKITNKKLLGNESLVQFGLDSITKSDFMTLFNNLISRNNAYYDILDSLWEDIQKHKLYSYDDIKEFLDSPDAKDYKGITKKILMKGLKLMEDNYVLGNTYDPINIVEDLKNKEFSILDLKGMLNYSGVNNPVSVYVAILLRHIYEGKVSKRINKDWSNMIVIDEVNKYVPRGGSPSSKQEFLNILDLSRSEKISLVYSTQDYKRIPDTLIKQASLVFLSYRTALDELADIVKILLPQEYDVPQTFKSKMSDVKRELRKYGDGRRDWLVINTEAQRYDYVTPVMPLSHLIVEGE